MKVSVVIPAYNEEKKIGKCLSHILNQEEKADEIIVVDNNSTDKTAQIAKKYGARVIKEKTQGIASARNTGFNNAKYEIIARTDADTYVPKDWIKLIKENFTNNKDLVGLSGTANFYDFPISNKLQHSQWQNKAVFAFIKSQIKHDTLYGPNMSILKSAWEKIKQEVCLDDKLAHEDTDLAIHLGQYGNMKIDPRLVVNTSFRRYKKLYTYFEYPRKLLKTFSMHNLKKIHVYAHNTTSYTHAIGLIDVLWKEFKSDQENFPDTAILYLPGWSLNPSSKPVDKLCKKIAEELKIRTYTIHTRPENFIDNSLFYQAQNIKELLQKIKPTIKNLILITHSQGAIKTIHLAHMLNENIECEVKGIICITPVGFYKMGKFELQIKFLGETVKAIFGSFKEILQENKAATELTLAVISYVKNAVKKERLMLYGKRVNQETRELTNSFPVIMTKLKEIKAKIAFVLAERDLISSSKKIKNTLEKSNLKHISIIEKKNTNHGLPYIHKEMLVQEMEVIVKDFLKN